MNRCFQRLTVVAACLAGLAGPPAHAAKGDRVAFTVAPDYFEKKIGKIAILDVITPRGVDDRVFEIEDMIQFALQEQGDFEILFPSDFKSAAERGGARTAYEALLRVWRSRREIEAPSFAKVVPATSIDALIAAEVTHFEQEKIDFHVEGNSTTTVGLKIQMFDATDRHVLWEASIIKVEKSQPYKPDAYITADASGRSQQRVNVVPEPPEYDLTSQKVVDLVIGTFPKAENEKSDKKKKAGKAEDKDADKSE
jgi:hypothetical protein